MSASTPYTTQPALPRGAKVTESDDYVTVVTDVKGNTLEVPKWEYARFLEIETRKRDRTLSKDARQAARSLAEIILNRWCERRKGKAEKTRPSRKRSACDMLSEPTDMSSPASSQSDLPNDLGTLPKVPKTRLRRGTIISSRPGFHTVVVDSSNNTLEVPEDEYNKWYSLYERKSDADSSIDSRLANRARAKNMMDNWCKRRKRAKKSTGSCAGEVPVDDDGYAAAMALMGLSYVS
ncbi:unnamed protein product [Rhizoctonia solani]|uniref:Uncharacterized protein n=1 Tax=Rhizoctonia solani TaxID=456999 RepID=A0A8H3BP18_9AGAM|nr:unnamed protein product [Rhizoctonia solani]